MDERSVAETRDHIKGKAFVEAMKEGASMTLEDAAVLALRAAREDPGGTADAQAGAAPSD